jgi:two-component system, LytTR family, response regulator
MQFKISVIVIDDERPAREEIIDLLTGYKDIEIIAVCKNAFEAKVEIDKRSPDVIFLDIAMPQKNGFDLLAELKIIPQTVFVTAYDEFAIKAFEENALDYLLKPIMKERLDKTIRKIRQLVNLNKPPENTLFRNLFIRDKYDFYIINLREVFLIESYGNYIKIHFGEDKTVLQPYTLKEAGLFLPKFPFIRINNSQIINIEYVDKFSITTSRRLKIILKNLNEPFFTSSRKSAGIRQQLTSKLSNR